MELYNLQLKVVERKRENYVPNKSAESVDSKELNKFIRQSVHWKLLICNEEESQLKIKLNQIKMATNAESDQLQKLYNETDGDFKLEEIKKLFAALNADKELDIEHELIDCKIEFDEDDENDFHDTYEDPALLNAEIAKEEAHKINQINSLKQKILQLGAKKASLRLSLVNKIVNEFNKIYSNCLSVIKVKMSEEEKLNKEREIIETPIKTFIVNLFGLLFGCLLHKNCLIQQRKQDDLIQQDFFVQNRRKAYERVKEYKQVI